MSKRIVVIEDEDPLREDLVEVLSENGYDVCAGANGREGLAMILADPPDLVLCDRLMPELSGYDVLEHLRQKRPDLSTMPFIFLTALNDARDRHAVADLTPTLYLGKPIDYKDLLRLVGDLLRGGNIAA
jgi:CheY-like chemotaxis protein